MKTLIAAPCVGEIGWELMAWQARVRWHFRHGAFDQLLVLGGPGREAFYADMPCTYRVMDLSSLPGTAYEDRRLDPASRLPVTACDIRNHVAPAVDAAIRQIEQRTHNYSVLWPEYAGRLWPCNASHQAFIRFERPLLHPPSRPWVVLVPRTRGYRADDNWSAEQWDELSARLRQRGIHTTVYPPEAEAAIAALSGCDLAVGQSTGGLHLASLCGCPHLVWAGNSGRVASPWQITGRQRYETMWNPLGTPVRFSPVDRPTCAEVERWVLCGLREIGRTTARGVQRTRFMVRWRARRWIADHVIHRPSFNRWPWKVQQFVRYGLV